LTEKGLVTAIKDLRKGSTVNSQTQETTFNALNKYAKNLNELARRANWTRSSAGMRRFVGLAYLIAAHKNNPILSASRGW